MNSRYVFRVDASIQIGTGHVMRCVTLAKELEKRNVECVFVCQNNIGNNIALIRNYGFKVLEIEANKEKFNFKIDAKNTLEVIAGQKYDWLIIDHYDIDINWELQVQSIAKNIMVIDDLADRRHKCDILLDQNLRINSKERYANLIPSECISLFGPSNVILRNEFDDFKITHRTGEINHILVYFGANDIHNQAYKSIKALQQYSNISADIIIGSNHPFQEIVLKESTSKLTVSNSIDMCAAMNRADLAFGVCGIAAWERCAMGLPTLACINAENQREDSENLHLLGAIHLLGESIEIETQDWLDALNYALNNKIIISEMGKIAGQVVAGHTQNRQNLVNLLCN